MSSQDTRISKLMSLVLRHKPETIGVKLDENGWLPVEELLQGIKRKGISIDRERLNRVVETNNKKRFIFNEDGTLIRANQGHSINVDLNLKAVEPPALLYHGTVRNVLDLIKKKGLIKMSRQHVHLSKDLKTATTVGARRGFPIILKVDAAAMHADNHAFYCSENGVWLTDHVPPQYIEFP